MTEELISILKEYVEADEITAASEFKDDLGVGSFDIVCMISDIEKKTGVKLKSGDFVKNKTVGELAAYIDSLK